MDLSKEFGKERSILLSISFLLILNFFFPNTISTIPYFNIDSTNFKKFSLIIIILLLNIFFLFRLSIEWYKSTNDSRNRLINKIDFKSSSLIGIISSLMTIYKLFPNIWLWDLYPVETLLLLFSGYIMSIIIDSNLFGLMFIRSNKINILPKIPYAVKINLVFGIVTISLLYILTKFIVTNYASNILQEHWSFLIIIPIIINSIFFLIQKRSYSEKDLAYLQSAFDQHEIATKFHFNSPSIDKKNLPTTCLPCSDIEYQKIKDKLANGFNPNTYIDNGWTPFILSIANKDMRLAKLYIEYGANLNIVNTMGRSAMSFAIKYNAIEFVKLLINENCDIHLYSNLPYADPYLIEAVNIGNIDIVRLLVDAGVDISLKNFDNKTALDYAEENQYGEIAKILRKLTVSKQ